MSCRYVLYTSYTVAQEAEGHRQVQFRSGDMTHQIMYEMVVLPTVALHREEPVTCRS